MSHIVTVRSQIKDFAAVEAACRRLGIAQPTHGKATLYSGQVEGLIVSLPGWTYPVVINTTTGEVKYDNYEGAWGEQRHLDAFLQMYSVEKAKLEARAQGYTVSEQTLQNGSIRLQINQGA